MKPQAAFKRLRESPERGFVLHLTPFFESGKLPDRHPFENLAPSPDSPDWGNDF